MSFIKTIPPRLALLALFILMPFALAAAWPWAWYSGLAQWGHTTLDEWKEDAKLYFQWSTLTSFPRLFYAPIDEI